MSSVINKEIEAYLAIRNRLDFYKVAELLNFTPHTGQKCIFDTLNEGNFETLIATLGRRFGKTTAIGKIAAGELLCPFASVLIIAPTTQNAKVLFSQVYQDILALNLKIDTKDLKGMTFTLKNGGRLQVVTGNNYDAARGFHFSLVIYEEYTFIPHLREIFDEVISPAQADYGVGENGYQNSKTIMIGTPTYEGTEAHYYFRQGTEGAYKVDGVVSFSLPTWTNPLISKEFIETQRKKLDKESFDREYGAKWSKISSGKIYHNFDLDIHTVSRDVINEAIKTKGLWLAGVDLGFSDNTAYVLAFVQIGTGNIYVVAEYQAAQRPTSEHYNSYKALEEEWGVGGDGLPIYRYGDPSCAQIWADLANDYKYLVNPAYNKIAEGVKTVNNYFAKPQLFISHECKSLIAQVDEMQWKDPEKLVVSRGKKVGHYDLAIAALRYMVATWDKIGQYEVIIV